MNQIKFFPRRIRIIQNTDPKGTPSIKAGDTYMTVKPDTPELIKLMEQYPKSVLINLKGFGKYRVDEIEFELIKKLN